MVSRYGDVLAALRDRRLSAGCVAPGFRQAAAAAIGSLQLPLADGMQWNVSDETDLISDLARPWSLHIASGVTGAVGDHFTGLAADIFASAGDPCDNELRLRSEKATIELARRFNGPLASLWVQAFVALSQSLPAFLGNAWLALLQQRVAIECPLLATEELLRYAGPAVAQFRTAIEDVELGGARIRTGDRLALMLAAANRDSDVFSDPERLDLQRRPNPHLAFGAGGHSCIGATLIRRAASNAITEFVKHLGNAEVVEYQLSKAFAIRSVTRLRVRRCA